MRPPDERGFSLLETTIALALVAIALCSLVQLVVVSTNSNAEARRLSLASILARQKVEELRALGPDLSPQPAASLDANTAGLCDFLNEYGRSLGTGQAAPPGTMYVRRWSIVPLPDDPADSMVLQVVVVPTVWHGVPLPAGADPRLFGGAQLVTVKTRRPA